MSVDPCRGSFHRKIKISARQFGQDWCIFVFFSSHGTYTLILVDMLILGGFHTLPRPSSGVVSIEPPSFISTFSWLLVFVCMFTHFFGRGRFMWCFFYFQGLCCVFSFVFSRGEQRVPRAHFFFGFSRGKAFFLLLCFLYLGRPLVLYRPIVFPDGYLA